MAKIKNDLINKNIIALLNLDQLPESQQAMLLDKMTNIVNQRLLLRILDSLKEKQKKEFEKIMDKGADAELEDFMIKNVPNFIDMMAEEILKIKTEVVDHLKADK